MAYLPLVIILLIAISDRCLVRSCTVVNWKPRTLAEQAAEAKIIVYGSVDAHYPPNEMSYTANMDVLCVLKGEALPSRINISRAGRLTSCDHTDLPVNHTYIVLLQMDNSGAFFPDEGNYLSAAFDATDDNFQQVIDATGGSAEERCPLLAMANGSTAAVMFGFYHLKAVMLIVAWLSTILTTGNI